MHFAIQQLIAFCLLGLSLMACCQLQADDSNFAKANEVLTKYCAGCHNAGDSNGEFALDTFEGLLKGGENGIALTPGSAASSRIIQMMRGKLEPKMPPDDEPTPSADEIQIIADWIDSGAKGPDGNGSWPNKLNTPKMEAAVRPQPITALAFSRNEKRIAIGTFEKIELRDRDGNRVLKTILDLPGKVTSVLFLKNDEFLLAGTGVAGLFGEAVLIRLSDGNVVRRFRGHRDMVYSIALSADETWLATAGYDRKSVLWNIEDDQPVREFVGHNDAVFDIAFDPTGTRLISASADATVKVWRVADGSRLDTRGEALKEQYTAAVSPDGQWIVAGGEDNRIRKWKLVSFDANQTNPLEIARFAHESAIQVLRFHGTGEHLVSIASNGVIKIWETETLTQVHRFETSGESIQALAVGDDRLAIGRMNGTLELLDWPTELLQNQSNRTTAVASDSFVENPTSDSPEELEQMIERDEPNDLISQAGVYKAPFRVTGTIQSDSGHDVDIFGFESLQGQRWIIEAKSETENRLDTHLEILDGSGQPVPRVLLRAVRDSYFTFRGKDSKQTGDFRIHNWEEMKLNQLLYCNGEVVRLFHYPRGPDSGFNVYPNFGNRHTMFDTTPIAHALHEPCFVVEAHAPGSNFPATGLPQFLLNYENDDDPEQERGTDSRLTFVAPADGEYFVRVRDTRNFGGEDFMFTLFVRHEKPDFAVQDVIGDKPTLLRGSYKRMGITIDRIDNFTGPVEIKISGLPPGVEANGPITVEENGLRAFFVLHASLDAELTKEVEPAPTLTATAMINGRLVSRTESIGELKLGDPPMLMVQLKHAPDSMPHFDDTGLPVLELRPGETIRAEVAVTRKGYEDRVNFGKEDAALNLPFGVYVDNTGLNGVLIPPGENKRTFFLTAEEWVKPCSRLIFLEAEEAGKPSSNPAVLRVLPAKH